MYQIKNEGQKDALKVLEEVELFDYVVNVGDAKSLTVYPASSTHFGVPKESAYVFLQESKIQII